MRISEVHIYQKDLQLKQPYTMAGTELHALDSTVVKLVCDNGYSVGVKPAPSVPLINRNTLQARELR